MKKLFVLILALFFVPSLTSCASNEPQPTLTGYFIATVGNSQILIVDEEHFSSGVSGRFSPISMHNNSENEFLFENLQTGDRISVSYNGEIADSFPAQMWVYGYELLEQGSVENVPQEIFELLIEMGWIVDERVASNILYGQQYVYDPMGETGYAIHKIGHVAITHPAGWNAVRSLVPYGYAVDIFAPNVDFDLPHTIVRIIDEYDLWNLTAEEWLNEIHGFEYGVVQINGVDVAIATMQVMERAPTLHFELHETTRRITEMRIPLDGRLYTVSAVFDTAYTDEYKIITAMLDSLHVMGERSTLAIEFSLEPTAQIEFSEYVFDNMTLLIPAHWEYRRIEQEASSVFSAGYFVVFFNPEFNHETLVIEVVEDVWSFTPQEWLGLTANESQGTPDALPPESFPDRLPISAITQIDGVEAAHSVTENDPDRAFEKIRIPYNGLLYTVKFFRSTTWDAELEIFDVVRASISFR